MIFLDIFKSDSQSFDSMRIINLSLEALLITKVPLILLNNKKDPKIFQITPFRIFNWVSILHRFKIVINGPFESCSDIIELFFSETILNLRVLIWIVIQRQLVLVFVKDLGLHLVHSLWKTGESCSNGVKLYQFKWVGCTVKHVIWSQYEHLNVLPLIFGHFIKGLTYIN